MVCQRALTEGTWHGRPEFTDWGKVMPRRKLALYLLLILVAVTIPVLFGHNPITHADLFDSPISIYGYLPLIQNDPFTSPVPPPAILLYLPLVVRS